MTDAGRVITIDVGQVPGGAGGGGGSPRATVVEGDTGPEWHIGHRTSGSIRTAIELAVLDGNYSCWFAVAESAPAILREVTEKNETNTRFRVSPTPAETAALGASARLIGLELRNPTLNPPLVAEVQWWLDILPGVVTAPAPGIAAGTLDFSQPTQSGLLALILEDF